MSYPIEQYYQVAAAVVMLSAFICIVIPKRKKHLTYKTISKIKIMEHEKLESLEGNINAWLEASEVKPKSMQWFNKEGINVVIVSYVVLTSRVE